MMNKIKKYPSLVRLENAVIEEKLDGSNVAIEFKKTPILIHGDINIIRTFSRTQEITNSKEQPFKSFSKWVLEQDWKWFTNFYNEMGYNDRPEKITIFGELIRNGHIKYGIENLEIPEKFFIFDLLVEYRTHKVWYSRSKIESIFSDKLKLVPLTTINNKQSQLNNEVLREGIILKFWGNDTQTKLKVVERKNRGGKCKKQKIEITELGDE